jgi:hypothetical protein
MSQRPTLEAKLAELANRFRFVGIGLTTLAAVAFLFSPRGADWPSDPLSEVFAVIFAVGCTFLVCGQLVVRKIVGFGSMEPPPVTIPWTKG